MWLLPISGSAAHTSPVGLQLLACPFTELVPTECFPNMCLKHLYQVASSWLLGVPGWSGGMAPLPRLCTPAGPLAQRKLLGGHVSCHISGPVSPVCTQTYLGHELRPGCNLDVPEIHSWLVSLVQLCLVWPRGVLMSACELLLYVKTYNNSASFENTHYQALPESIRCACSYTLLEHHCTHRWFLSCCTDGGTYLKNKTAESKTTW